MKFGDKLLDEVLFKPSEKFFQKFVERKTGVESIQNPQNHQPWFQKEQVTGHLRASSNLITRMIKFGVNTVIVHLTLTKHVGSYMGHLQIRSHAVKTMEAKGIKQPLKAVYLNFSCLFDK